MVCYALSSLKNTKNKNAVVEISTLMANMMAQSILHRCLPFTVQLQLSVDLGPVV